MDHITAADFESLLDIYNAKLVFNREDTEYYKKGFIERLFIRAPKNPAPGVSSTELFTLVSFAFEQAYPDLNFDSLDVDGRRCMCRTTLTRQSDGSVGLHSRVTDIGSNTYHDEFFEPKKGYGFIHQYQHYDDREKDNHNRQYAHEHFMSGRMGGDPFRHFYKALDAFRTGETARKISDGQTLSGVRPRAGFLKEVSAYHGNYKDNMKLCYEQCSKIERPERFTHDSKAVSYLDVVSARMHMRRISTGIAPVSYSRAYEGIKFYDSYTAFLNRIDKAGIYENSRSGERVSNLDEILYHSEMEAMLSPDRLFMGVKNGTELDTMRKFAKNAFDAGYSLPVVKDKLVEFAELNGLDANFVDVNKAYSDAAQSYFDYLIRQADIAVNDRIPHASQVQVKRPEVVYQNRIDYLLDNGGRECLKTIRAKYKELRKDVPVATETEGHLVYTVFPDDVRSGVLPKGVNGFYTDEGVPCVGFSSGNREVPSDGLVLVKDKNPLKTDYTAFNQKTFGVLFEKCQDGSFKRKEAIQAMKPGLRREMKV